MFKKWFFPVALMLALSLLLVGCGGKGNPQGKDKQPSEKTASKSASFPQKDIRLIVPFNPGGLFDTEARMLAPFIEKNLPQKVNVVVENVAGADSKLGLMRIYKAEPDGYTIGLFHIPGQVTEQVMNKVDYDMNKVSWLGRISQTTYVLAVSSKTSIKSLEDLKNAKTSRFAMSAMTGGGGLGIGIASKEIGFEINPIPHEGSNDAVMTVLRGDAEAVQYPYSTVAKFVESKELRPIVVYSPKRLPEMPDVPTIAEAGYPQLLDPVKQDVLIGTTPGVPEEVLKVLREAIWKAMNEPQFKDMAVKAGHEISPAQDPEVVKSIEGSFQSMNKYKGVIQEYLGKIKK